MARPHLSHPRPPELAFGIESLASLLTIGRRELMRRWETLVHEKLETEGVDRFELMTTMPPFLDELVSSLQRVGFSDRTAMMTGPMSVIAVVHGEQRLRLGFRVDEVVREYGLLQEAILDLAQAHGYVIKPVEHKVLARAISRATAQAVSEYARGRDEDLQRQASEHFAFVAHELRNPLTSARVAHDILTRRGSSSGPLEVLGRSLARLSSLIDESLTAARLGGKMPLRVECFAVRTLLDDAIAESATDAEAKSIALVAHTPEVDLTGDRRVLRSVVTNLLRNAIKFTHDGGRVTVRAHVSPDNIRVEVEDTCGGIPEEKLDGVFKPFVQVGADRSGFGLGLAIARQGVEAHGGSLTVHNVDHGCVFAVDLPRSEPALEHSA
jgi:signal transduction histidine kinase